MSIKMILHLNRKFFKNIEVTQVVKRLVYKHKKKIPVL